jgi:hypothetical protein
MRNFLLLACSAALIAGCSNNQAAEDKMERAAETGATVAGPLPAALGLSEAEILDADIVDADGKELGEVAQVVRGPDDKVDRLLVELDGGLKDRYIHVPVTGLKKVVRGGETDLETPLTKSDLAALPEVKLPAP